MEKKQYIMALDQGTTSSRCILFDKKGNITSMAQKEFDRSIQKRAGWNIIPWKSGHLSLR